MNNYYVSAGRGSDASGTGTAINPWKTISKAIGNAASASLGSNGARIYIEPGTYYEAVTLGLTPTSSTRLEIIGDCDGAGFLAGGQASPSTGIVDWSAWSSDSAVANGPCLFGGAKSFVTLRRLKMHGGNFSGGSCVGVTSGQSWTLADSIFVPYIGSVAVSFGATSSPATSGLDLTIDRCDFHIAGNNGGRGVSISAAEAGAEYSLQSRIRNCRFWGAVGIQLSRVANGLGSLGSGLTVEHCSFMLTSSSGGGVAIYTSDSIPLSTPVQVRGSVFFGHTGLSAGHLSHISEDWNAIHCTTSRTSVAAGPNSSTNFRPAIDREDGRLVGTPLRPHGLPTPGSPLAGFVGAGTTVTTDLMGRARPEGFQSTRNAAGALERHDTGELNTAMADTGSAGCLSLRGPSSLERPILVDSTSVAISVKVRWDGNHGDSRKPQAILLANPEIGIATDQVVTASSTGGTGSTPNGYETLNFSQFTPSRPGALMLRLVSRSSTGTGVAYFDSITLS